jgi:hypothetical protein
MFKNIASIQDIQPFVIAKPEIKWARHTNGVTVGCYMFQDRDTFDSVESLECRGIAFDDQGRVLSRPLHKFFNAGERADVVTPESMAAMGCVYAVYEKLDDIYIWTTGRRLGATVPQVLYVRRSEDRGRPRAERKERRRRMGSRALL